MEIIHKILTKTDNNEILFWSIIYMVYAWIIPIGIVAILGVSGYLVYRYVIFDILANNTVNNTLKRYNIKKTQFEIIKEFNENKGEKLSDAEINRLAKHYRRNEPDQFLSISRASSIADSFNERYACTSLSTSLIGWRRGNHSSSKINENWSWGSYWACR